MKKPAILFAIAAFCLVPPAVRAADAVPQGDTDMLKTLRPGHPRLMLTNEGLVQLRQRIAADAGARKLAESVRTRARSCLTKPTCEFKIVGPRLLSQSRYCVDVVTTTALMYRLDGDKAFAERAIKELKAAAEFPHWNPRHFLDTAEMSHAFAIGYDWLYDVLSEADRAVIRTALIEKGLTPALEGYRSGAWWSRCHHNWNQVCNGGITCGALALADEEPALAGELIRSAVQGIPLAMKSYAPDGGWAEGPGYWSYATRYNVYFLAAMETALGPASIEPFVKMPGFDRAGFFRIGFCGPSDQTFNFADAGSRAGSTPEMFWLARHFDQPLFAWHQRTMMRDGSAHDLLWYDPRGDGPIADTFPLDALFTGVDVAFLRSAWEDPNALFVGFKGGDNRANHSHLDLGSFVLDALGKRWALDLGGDDYNLPAYFGNKRWTYYRLRTESHNTLLINNDNQDPRAPAPMIAFGSRPDRGRAVADLSKANGDAVKRHLRGIALLDRKHVLVQDELEAPRPVEARWSMLTPAKVQVDGDRAILTQGTAHLLARVLEPKGAVFETVSANPPRPQRQQPDVTNLVVKLPDKVTGTRIAVLLSPYEGAEAPAYTPRITGLDTWVEEDKIAK